MGIISFLFFKIKFNQKKNPKEGGGGVRGVMGGGGVIHIKILKGG